MVIFLNYVLPALIGIFATFLSWFFVKLFFSPKLELSEAISKKEVNGRTAYRVKIKNCGYRKCSDILIYAKLEVRKLNGQSDTYVNSFFVNMSFDGVYPVLHQGKSIVLHIYNEVKYDKNYYSVDFVERISNACSIEELLNVTEDTRLILYVMATDNFSGARKVFTSKEYTLLNIIKRPFCKDSVKIKESASQNETVCKAQSNATMD